MPKDVPNVASIAPTSSEIEIGNKYTIKCSPNFVIEPSQAELSCQEDGTLSPTAECVPGTCSKPALTDNIESISPDMDSVNAGEKFTVKCKSNHAPEYSELNCQTDGSVSSIDHRDPKCNEVLDDDGESVTSKWLFEVFGVDVLHFYEWMNRMQCRYLVIHSQMQCPGKDVTKLNKYKF